MHVNENSQFQTTLCLNDGPRAIERARRLLIEGQVVALPFETVYGLAADATSPNAIERIYQAKGRPAWNPLIVHLRSDQNNIVDLVGLGWLGSLSEHQRTTAQRLADQFWPGPLTIVLPRGPRIPIEVTAGRSLVGIRIPNSLIVQKILSVLEVPLAAPSANPSNSISPTTAQHVVDGLGGKIPLIIDGGPCHVGIESTVVMVEDCGQIRILRPGGISVQDLSALAPVALGGEVEVSKDHPPASPGLSSLHYAPQKPLHLLSSRDSYEECIRQLLDENPSLLRIGVLDLAPPVEGRTFTYIAQKPLPVIQFWNLDDEGDGEVVARALYQTMHQMDHSDAEVLITILPPQVDFGLWPAILDRLKRASVRKN